MSLQQEIETRSKEILTDSYSISVGEAISMYKDEDIDIHPEFQRFFRWTTAQKTRLIESFLLNIPVPPIYVSQRADGVWDIIDGLQRLSTIFHFVGCYKNADGSYLEPLVLEKTKLLPSLEGKKFKDEDCPEKSFNEDERRFLKRAKLSFVIIKKESDSSSKYELFQRLNSGGTNLSEQEIRNCIMVMTNPQLFNCIEELSRYPNFIDSLRLTDKAIAERYDLELVTRFLCLRTEVMEKIKNISDYGTYLNDRIVELFETKTNWEEEFSIFKKTFDIIYEALGDEAFCKYDIINDKFSGRFYTSVFEFVAIGLGRHDGQTNRDCLKGRIVELWKKIDSEDISWKGSNPSGRLQKTLELANQLYAEEQIN